MAHNLGELNGKTQFVEVLHHGNIKPAWHGLGTKYDDPLTIEMAMKEAQADFTVEQQPVMGLSPEIMDAIGRGEMISPELIQKHIIKGYSCNMNVRDSQTYAITSDRYGVIQNLEAFHFINNICGVDKNAPVIDTMGVLTDGTTFASIRMKNVYDLGNDDEVDMYLVVKNSFNNKEVFSVLVSPQRVVCQNTLNAAFRHAQSRLAFKHTKHVSSRLDAEVAARTLGFFNTYKDAFAENMLKLKGISLSGKQVEDVVCKVVMLPDSYEIYKKEGLKSENLSTRTKNSVENALEVIEVGIGQKECKEKGSGLWLYNGITTLVNNHTAYKSPEKKFNSVFGGAGDSKQQICFNEIIKLAV